MVWHFVERDMIAQDLYLRSGVHFDTLFFFILAQCTRNHYLFSTSKKRTEKGNSLAYDTSEKSRDILWLEKKAGKLA